MMTTRRTQILRKWKAPLAALALMLSTAPAMRAQSEVPAGTRFMVELRDKLDARKVKPGKKFDVRTIDAMQASDGSVIPAWTKIHGRVSYVEHDKIILRLEQIEAPGGKIPIVATVTNVVGEKDVKSKASDEGEIKADSHRGRNAAIGAVVLGGIGAAVGATRGGGKGAAIGAGVGAGTGAAIGAASGSKDLVLNDGTRIEFELDRPLVLRGWRY
jgi:hypothetical protein